MVYVIAYLLNLFDLAMTSLWVKLYGIGAEGNPIGLWLLTTNLAIPVKVIGIGAALFALHACIKRKPRLKWTSWVVLGVYGALGIYHIIIASIVI